ncbi:glycoside hydrolase family 97 protein [Pedobacter panaciterrae]|uniref:Glycoside hydrolase family 97 protein n=1 Tax=Pedobacter panaciterrae TaxID=363849 RepID=A0ABU8NJF0_9SPHI|nr:glycoside hydrolase family 97 protein [Pedobacter panaciterrae]NQX56012.1 glycoside hydrolase family 97 protein [Pedobacter panaciterrae]
MSAELIAKDKRFQLNSPNNTLKVKVSMGDSITYSISFKNKTVILPSAIAMVLQNKVLGKTTQVNNIRVIKNKEFNELSVLFSDQNYSLIFRAYNEGVAYRFVTSFKDSIQVVAEKADFNINGKPAAILQETDNYTSWEGPYIKYPSIAEISNGKRATTPALFDDKSNGIKVVIAESDLFGYPGMYIKKQGDQYIGDWAKFPTKTVMGSWGDFVSVVKERGDYLAKTDGSRSFPWRVIIATDNDKDLLNNHLVTKLARPSEIKDTSWIKSGKAAWEWWHDAMLPGASIPSGMANRNTDLYNYYVDFAAANKLEYMMIDAGWSNNYDLTKVNPKLDVQGVIKRAREKKVGVFLWCVASTLLKDLNKNLDFLNSIGAAGIKVDFFDRDDQEAIQWIELIAKEAAKRKLMIDFHGCSKPTGLEKTYPNIVNYEAVRGAESDKWDNTIDPDHHLIIPFVRMLAGPFDYTPGAMRNKTKAEFKPIDPGLPSGQGTRCHELAMYVIYDQPLGMLADSPTEYEKAPDIMKYLSAVPTVADETKVIDAKLAEYAVMAKRKGDNWYVGAMTNWTPRNLKLNFSFLKPGVSYTAQIYTDTKDSNVNATQYELKTISVNSNTTIDLKLSSGGGAAIMIEKSIFKK